MIDSTISENIGRFTAPLNTMKARQRTNDQAGNRDKAVTKRQRLILGENNTILSTVHDPSSCWIVDLELVQVDCNLVSYL